MSKIVRRARTNRNIWQILSWFFPSFLWWLGNFPGKVTPDSWSTFAAIRGDSFFNLQPIFYQFFIKWISFDLRLLSFISLVGVLFLSWSVAVFVRSVLGKQNEKTSLIIFLVCASPWVGSFGTTIWKDVPYTACLLLLVSTVIESIRRDQIQFVKVFVVVIGCCLFRLNGFATVMAFSLILVLIFIWATRSRKKILFVLGAVITFAGISGFLANSILESKYVVRDWAYVSKMSAPITDIAYALAQSDENLIPQEFRVGYFYRLGMSDKMLEGASDCLNSWPWMSRPETDMFAFPRDSKLVINTWLAVLKVRPDLILEHRFCAVNNLIPFPITLSPGIKDGYGLSLVNASDPDGNSWYPNSTLQPLNEIFRIVTGLGHYFETTLVWPGMGLTFVLLWVWRSLRSDSALTVLALILSSHGILLIAGIAQDVRYAQFSVIVQVFLICSWLVRKLPLKPIQ